MEIFKVRVCATPHLGVGQNYAVPYMCYMNISPISEKAGFTKQKNRIILHKIFKRAVLKRPESRTCHV